MLPGPLRSYIKECQQSLIRRVERIAHDHPRRQELHNAVAVEFGLLLGEFDRMERDIYEILSIRKDIQP